MADRIKAVKSAFHSICWKLPVGLMIPTIIAMLFFASYFTASLQQRSIELYEQQTEAAFETSAKNIDYYISSCVSSARSVYINDDLLTFLRYKKQSYTTIEERNMIFSYLKTVYYSISKAKQIFLAIPQINTSFLYLTDNLWNSTTDMKVSVDDMPEFSDFRDIVIEPTHLAGTYGHLVGFHNTSPDIVDKMVFTIWIPIYNLPYTNTLSAYLAIDMPIGFIMENCQLAYDETEKVYIINAQGDIMASSDKTVVHENIGNIYTTTGDFDSSEFTSFTDGDLLIMQAPIDSKYVGWKIVKVVPVSNIYGSTWGQGQILLVTILVILVIVLGINIIQVLHYMIPIKQVTSYMSLVVRSRSWRKDISLSDYVTYKTDDEIGVLIETFGTMMRSINDYTVRQFELELAYTKSVLKMLQAQINPHFIYNTIQCFATNALKNKNPEQYHLISSFGQMLRYAMILDPPIVPFFKEVEYVKRYIELQKMRFGSENCAEFYIHPDTAGVMVPKMFLQPMVENSFIHGRVFCAQGSILKISAKLAGESMWITITDNGVPISPADMERIYEKMSRVGRLFTVTGRQRDVHIGDTLQEESGEDGSVQGYGIGLENVYARILLSHHTCEFKIFANELGGTTVVVTFPIAVAQETMLTKDNRGNSR